MWQFSKKFLDFYGHNEHIVCQYENTNKIFNFTRVAQLLLKLKLS